jgi:hypothetical protein
VIDDCFGLRAIVTRPNIHGLDPVDLNFRLLERVAESGGHGVIETPKNPQGGGPIGPLEEQDVVVWMGLEGIVEFEASARVAGRTDEGPRGRLRAD